MIIVADTSALIALALCEQLVLIEAVFGSVFVPPAVYAEATQNNKVFAKELTDYLQDKILPIQQERLEHLKKIIDPGEWEAMVLYQQINADLLLVDDKKARKVAVSNQFQIIGSLGVLLRAKEMGFISEVRPFILKLQDSQLFLSDRVLEQVLKLAGETL